jgi:hypothetical protein
MLGNIFDRGKSGRNGSDAAIDIVVGQVRVDLACFILAIFFRSWYSSSIEPARHGGCGCTPGADLLRSRRGNRKAESVKRNRQRLREMEGSRSEPSAPPRGKELYAVRTHGVVDEDEPDTIPIEARADLNDDPFFVGEDSDSKSDEQEIEE